jgi:GH25 family lysozyme M1 (1,4-beta-N-acetylmuramidase)
MQGMEAGKIKGIDVSNHNRQIHWEKVRQAGFTFMYAKATEGKTYQDHFYLTHIKEAQAAGLLVGAYHFARPENNPAKDEVENFIKRLNQFETDLLPVLDLESPTNKGVVSSKYLVDWTNTFADYLYEHTGQKIILFTGIWFIHLYNDFDQQLKQFPLWISYYRKSGNVPDAGGWTKWTIWQYTETGAVPGVNGDCDSNVAVSLEPIVTPESAKKHLAFLKTKFSRILFEQSPPMKGDDVKKVQYRMEIMVDGIFGPHTRYAVMNWQRVHDEHGRVIRAGKGLKVDGIVGPNTWYALFPDEKPQHG